MKSMSKKFLIVPLVLLNLLIIVAFQNCQPMTAANCANFSSSDNLGGSGNPSGGGGTANESYFNQNVKPVFEARCNTCHAEPRFVGPNGGPLTIYVYSAMRAKLAAGTSVTDNDLVRKVTGQLAHTGGNQCMSGVVATDPVCGKLMEWYQREFSSAPAAGQTAQLQSVSSAGQITGWAVNAANPANKVQVFFYRDNPVEAGGILMGNTTANQAGLGTMNGSYFIFNIPVANIDNRSHNLYVYLGSATAANLLPGSPFRYGAYMQTQAGINHYNANLAQTINQQCTLCHAFNIESAWGNMLSPTPFAGGTRTANNFIMNASGNGHPVNGCPGGINSGLCAQIQQWWTIEFGP